MQINTPIKTFLLFNFLLLACGLVYGQENIKFYLEPSADFLPAIETTDKREYVNTWWTQSRINADSAYNIREARKVELDDITSIEQSFGGGLRGMLEIPIGNRLSIRTGLGLRYEKYKIETRSENYTSTPISIPDTIGKIALTNSGGTTFTSCTIVYEGIGSFEEQLEFVPTYSNLLLEVPVAIRYELIPERFGLSLGATVVTPLRSTYEFINSRYNVLGHPEVPEGECATVVSLVNNTTGAQTADFQMGAEVSADYLIGQRLRLVASASQMLTDRFVQEEAQGITFGFSGSTPSYRPLQLSLGVQWQIGGGGVVVD